MLSCRKGTFIVPLHMPFPAFRNVVTCGIHVKKVTEKGDAFFAD